MNNAHGIERLEIEGDWWDDVNREAERAEVYRDAPPPEPITDAAIDDMYAAAMRGEPVKLLQAEGSAEWFFEK